MSRSEPAPLRVAFVTAPDAEVGGRIARALVEERWAACVNLVPGIRSLYRWEGELQDDSEVLLVVKTRADRIAGLAERLRALHPYELPELVALGVEDGLAGYLDWVRRESAP